jgi:L-ascorbate 6-phosphate lactonase
MAEIAQLGDELLADVERTQAPPGTGLFWWLGQHSFILKLGPKVVFIDPYLDPNDERQTPPLFAPEQVACADLVLCTHDHGDHIDPFALPGIAQASPQAMFVFPRPHRRRMLEIGLPEERLRPIGDGETLWLDGIAVSGIKSRHEFFHETPEGFPFMGYVVEGDGVCCYHSGDTLAYDGLRAALGRWKLDAAFLPINGRDAQRFRAGCIGNMTYQEAVDLAGDLEVGLAVPTHWDMFAGNSEDPRKFVDYLNAKFPGVRSWVGRAGERVEFGGR